MKKDRKGGIEGLPLQLMIIILVATLGTAVIVGWMGSIETPHSIGEVSFSDENIVLKNGLTANGFDVIVKDQDGNPLEGATVVLSGLGVNNGKNTTVYSVTDIDGHAKFSNRLSISLSGSVGHLTVTVSSPDHGESICKIPVVKG